MKQEIIHYKNFLGHIAIGYLCNYCHYLNQLKVFRQNETILHFVRRNIILYEVNCHNASKGNFEDDVIKEILDK